MKVELLQAGDHLSLEMDPAGLIAVQSLVRAAYPAATSDIVGVATTMITFGGSEFVFENEWDEPCFISKTREGDELLRSIYVQLT